MNQESHGAWESALLKTTPIMLMTSLIGKPWPNLPRKGLSKESNVMAFGDWKSDCRSSMEGNAVWRGMQCGGRREGAWKALQESGKAAVMWIWSGTWLYGETEESFPWKNPPGVMGRR